MQANSTKPMLCQCRSSGGHFIRVLTR